MRDNLKRKVVSIVLTMAVLVGYAIPSFTTVYALSENMLPEGFTSVAIGNNDGTGYVSFDETNKMMTIKGSGNYIGKDSGSTDSYQFVSFDVKGDSTIIARLADFDMSQSTYGQAGVFIRKDNSTDNADYIGVYVEPSKNQYRYAYRDNTSGGTGAASLSGLDGQSKGKYIKIEKQGTSCKVYVAEDTEFENIIVSNTQSLKTEGDTWNVGFVVSNGGSKIPATADFDNILIKDSTGTVYDSEQIEGEIPEIPEEPELPDYNQGILPDGFNNSSIGNNSKNVYANFDKDKKQFVVNGSGTYIGKDVGKTDNYQFVNYQVEGNATIVARLVNFDMSKALNGQAGVFVREDNSTENANYFGVYVEPSKDQYRYAYRDNSVEKSGAAQIGNLTGSSKNQFIKILKSGNEFKYYISEDETFPTDKTFSNTQTVSSDSNTWSVGFVVSNGGSETPAAATFDNVRIENESKVYYDSEVEEMPVNTVENVKAVGSDAKVTLTWNAVEDATSYIVKRATSKTGEYVNIAEINAPETTYVDNDVVNFDTYYYKIMAKNEKGNAHDSQVVVATPNNSNSSNIQYEGNAAIFDMTKEPNDTVSNSVITLEGSTNKDGFISIIQNGEIKVKSREKAANESFRQKLTLDPGRNIIEIYHTTEDGKNTVKTYNIVYLATTSYDKIVDSSYTGVDGEMVDGIRTYKTIASAIKSISDKNKERIIVFVKNGTYKEKLTIEAPYVSIIGEDSEKTVLTYDDAGGTINSATGVKYGTSKSASVTIKKKSVGFTAENITIENAFKETGSSDEQAVALNNQADQSIFVNCRFIGNQDTLLADADKASPARQYYYKCYIEGDVDFIFGRAQAVFNDCDIASFNRNSTTNNGYITAADTWDRDSYGYVIMNSRLIGLDNIAKDTVSLGRPWRPSSQTTPMTPAVTYLNCYMGDHITSKGWDDMGENSLASTSRFYEYGSYGPGAKSSDTRNVLSNKEVVNYTMDKVFAKNSATTEAGNDAHAFDWMPTEEASQVNINSWYENTTKVEKLELNATELSMNVEDSVQLIATVGPENVVNQTVIFESSNENIATVDETGYIKALKTGSAVITARIGNKQATCTVTVTYKQVEMNMVPVINAEDVMLTVGQDFNPMTNVTSSDYEDGDLTSSVEVVENTVDTTKAGEYKVVYKVTDSQGASITKEIKVVVNPKLTIINRIPVINAEDIVITEGSNFDAMENITANDYEDGDLTSSVEVVENTVDTTKAGEYKVLYKVTDSQGASATKVIKVIVEKQEIEKPEVDTDGSEEDTNKPGTDNEGSEEDTNEPETDNEGSGEDTNKPGIDNEGSEEDTNEPEVDNEGLEEDTNKPGADTDNNSSNTTSPETGDAGIFGLLAIAVAAIVGIFVINRKKLK